MIPDECFDWVEITDEFGEPIRIRILKERPANKPHARFSDGEWVIFRDKSDCPTEAPTVARRDIIDAFKAHYEHIRILRLRPDIARKLK